MNIRLGISRYREDGSVVVRCLDERPPGSETVIYFDLAPDHPAWDDSALFGDLIAKEVTKALGRYGIDINPAVGGHRNAGWN